MKTLYPRLRTRWNANETLRRLGGSLHLADRSQSAKPNTSVEGTLVESMDTFSTDIQRWHLNMRLHGAGYDSRKATDWLEAAIGEFKRDDFVASSGVILVDTDLIEVNDGVYDASVTFEAHVQRPISQTSDEPVIPETFVTDFIAVKENIITSSSPNGSTPPVEYWVLQSTSNHTTLVRTVMHFDVSSLAGATVDTASIFAHNDGENFDALAAFIRRLTVTGWVETEVTWNRASVALDWADGGEYTTVDQVAWTTPVSSTSSQFEIPGLAALVQDAIDNRSGQLHIILMLASEATADTIETMFGMRGGMKCVGGDNDSDDCSTGCLGGGVCTDVVPFLRVTGVAA